MVTKILLATMSIMLFFSNNAFATSKSVSSAGVTKDKQEVKMKGTIEHDDGDLTKWKNKIEYGYGVTDKLQLGIKGETEKKRGQSLEYKASEIKAKYQLTDDNYYLKSAVQAKYKMNHLGDADSVGLKLNLQKGYNAWDQRINFDFSREVGDDSESGVEFAIKAGTYRKFNGYKLGAEYYADFGNLSDNNGFEEQEHHLGPVVGFNIPVGQTKIGTKLGYLAGLSKASADHVVKYEFGVAF